jgi:initiation factor 1A
MRNRVWIHAGDIVLCGLRDFGDDGKGDVMLKYYDEESREL